LPLRSNGLDEHCKALPALAAQQRPSPKASSRMLADALLAKHGWKTMDTTQGAASAD
jgi:hypothetical protein